MLFKINTFLYHLKRKSVKMRESLLSCFVAQINIGLEHFRKDCNLVLAA